MRECWFEVGRTGADEILTRAKALYDELNGFKERYLKENVKEIAALLKGTAEKVIHEDLRSTKM
jgi:hypothetical protein